MDMQKLELQRLINSEHGINYHRNIDLGGYTFYLGESFLVFELCSVNGFIVAKISYVFVTNKKALLKLFAQVIEFWKGNEVKYIYYKTHRRRANVAEKFLESIGLKIIEDDNFHNWRHSWTSNNGFKECEILEAITDH